MLDRIQPVAWDERRTVWREREEQLRNKPDRIQHAATDEGTQRKPERRLRPRLKDVRQ